MAVSSIAFTMYPVTDVPRALAFYRDGLGLKPEGPDSEHWVEFDVAGATFGIGDFAQAGKAGTALSLVLEVDDLEAFRTQLAARGIQAGEPHPLANCRISVVSDPDGNQVWLHQVNAR